MRGDAEKDFGLNRIGVLELVDENVPVTCASFVERDPAARA